MYYFWSLVLNSWSEQYGFQHNNLIFYGGTILAFNIINCIVFGGPRSILDPNCSWCCWFVFGSKRRASVLPLAVSNKPLNGCPFQAMTDDAHVFHFFVTFGQCCSANLQMLLIMLLTKPHEWIKFVFFEMCLPNCWAAVQAGLSKVWMHFMRFNVQTHLYYYSTHKQACLTCVTVLFFLFSSRSQALKVLNGNSWQDAGWCGRLSSDHWPFRPHFDT